MIRTHCQSFRDIGRCQGTNTDEFIEFVSMKRVRSAIFSRNEKAPAHESTVRRGCVNLVSGQVPPERGSGCLAQWQRGRLTFGDERRAPCATRPRHDRVILGCGLRDRFDEACVGFHSPVSRCSGDVRLNASVCKSL